MNKDRQFMIESHGINIIRTNPDDEYFNMNRLINWIYRQNIKLIEKQTEKSTKKLLIDDLSKNLKSFSKIKLFKMDC